VKSSWMILCEFAGAWEWVSFAWIRWLHCKGGLCLLALHTREYLRLGVVRLLLILYQSFNC